MKNIFFLLTILSLSGRLCAQTRVSGTVLDTQRAPLSYATVQLLRAADSSFVQGTISNESGEFEWLSTSAGEFIVACSMVGYQTVYSSRIQLSASPERLTLPPFILPEDTRLLSEVLIEGKKPLLEQQIDRLVVNVQNSLTAAGSSALEVIGRAPGISVNKPANSLSMSGKAGVVVMINGKPSQLPMAAVLEMLAGMPADNIEKIELISAPPASYDAAGNAGIINLVLKQKDAPGISGTYYLAMGYGRYEKPGAGTSLGYRNRKLNVQANYSFLYDRAWQRISNYRQVFFNDRLTETHTHNDRKANTISHHARLAADYALSARTSLGLVVSGFSTDWNMLSHNTIAIREDAQAAQRITMQAKERNRWTHRMANLNLTHTFSDQRELSVNLDRLMYGNTNPTHYANTYLHLRESFETNDQVRIGKETPIQLWVAKADYGQNIGKNTRLETGLKGTRSRLTNAVLLENYSEEAWYREDELSGNYRLSEDIGAAYVNYHRQLEPGIKLQAGLRWEYTRTNLSSEEQPDIVARQYHRLFPSFSFIKETGKTNSIQASYSRRISRPSYTDLAPFVIFLDPFSLLSGNTALQPSVTDAVQVAYRFRNYQLSLQYSHDDNYIVPWQVSVDPATNTQYTFPDNIQAVNNLALSLNVPWNIAGWWQVENHVLAMTQRARTQVDGTEISLTNRHAQVSSTHTITLPAGFSLELSGFYKSPSLMGFGIQRSYGFINAGIQKKFPENKGTLILAVTDALATMRYAIRYQQPALHLQQELSYVEERPVLRLTYKRSFGREGKAAPGRATGSEDEQNRIKR